MTRRSDDRLAARALAANRIAAAEQRATPNLVFGPDAHARFRAVGDAHVIVTQDAIADVRSPWHRVTCEACGPLMRGDGFTEVEALECAQKHAETCRRIPERLWPEGGVR